VNGPGEMNPERVLGWGNVVCPDDRGRLKLRVGDGGNGRAVCQSCGHEYLMADGILSFSPEAESEGDIGLRDKKAIAQEHRKREGEAKSGTYDEVMGSPFLFACDIIPAIDLLHCGNGEICVDLGCGTGRMTIELARRGVRVIGIDFSLESLKVCRTKAKSEGIGERVCLVHADICKLPLKSSSVQKAASIGVYSQLPSASYRKQAFGELARVLSNSGQAVITVYNYSVFKRAARLPRDWQATEGWAPFHNFTANELRGELSPHLTVADTRGVVNLPARTLGDRLRKIGLFGVGVGISRRISHTFLSRYLGAYLLAQCTRK
jgi:SAM-dependent methyltransferase